jgi:hypothetical protein
MDKLHEDSETGCCQRFDPAPWNDKEVTWKGKLFVRDRVTSIFHIPLNFGQVIVRNMEKIKAADALPEKALMLSDENSLFGSDVYINVSRNVPGPGWRRYPAGSSRRPLKAPTRTWANGSRRCMSTPGRKAER